MAMSSQPVLKSGNCSGSLPVECVSMNNDRRVQELSRSAGTPKSSVLTESVFIGSLWHLIR